MITAWPLDACDYGLSAQSSGGDVQMIRRFEPDVGPPIDRAATTATMESWSLSAVIATSVDLETILAWGRSTLKGWVLPFVWRHPRNNAVTKWKFVSPPQIEGRGSQQSVLQISALRLPGTLWFAHYVPAGTLRLPAWVADYAGGVYGIGDERGEAADLSAISGTYDVLTRDDLGALSWSVESYSADVPTSAPTDTDWLVGFDPV